MSKKQKPRVRKPNNHHTRLGRMIDYTVRFLAVSYTNFSGACDIVDIANLDKPRMAQVSLSRAKGLTEFAHPWSVYIAVFGQVDGQPEYMKGEQLVLPYRMKQKDLAAGLNEYHQEFIARTINKSHLIGVGWIAIPRDIEITAEQADKIFSLSRNRQ